MRRCQRQLVFSHVLASHSARNSDRREAYVLKQLRDLSAWQGSLIHTVLATAGLRAIRHKQPLAVGHLVARTVDLAERQLAFSAARRYREPGQSKSAAGDAYCALVEHERGLEMPVDVLTQVEHTARRCFQYLAGQTAFLADLYAGSGHLAEEPVYVRIDGVLVVAVLDLVFVNSRGRVSIVDWKVAQSERSDYSRQMLVNAFVSMQSGRWPVARNGSVCVYEVNLLKNEIRPRDVDAQRLDDIEDFVYRGVTDFKTLLGDGTADDIDLNEFDVAASHRVCLHCRFQPLCVAQLTGAPQPEPAGAIQGGLW